MLRHTEAQRIVALQRPATTTASATRTDDNHDINDGKEPAHGRSHDQSPDDDDDDDKKAAQAKLSQHVENSDDDNRTSNFTV